MVRIFILRLFVLGLIAHLSFCLACSTSGGPGWQAWLDGNAPAIAKLQKQGMAFVQENSGLVQIKFPEINSTIILYDGLANFYWTPEQYIAMELYKTTKWTLRYSRENEKIQFIRVGKYQFETFDNFPAVYLMMYLVPEIIQSQFSKIPQEPYENPCAAMLAGGKSPFFSHTFLPNTQEKFLVLLTNDGKSIHKIFVFSGGGFSTYFTPKIIYHSSIENMLRNAGKYQETSGVILRFTGVISSVNSGYRVIQPVKTTGQQ